MSKEQGADSGIEKHADGKILDEGELDTSIQSTAVTPNSPEYATITSENHPRNNTQKTKMKSPSNTKVADSVLSGTSVPPQSVQDCKPTNVKPAESDMKEDSDFTPSQNKGAIPGSKKGKGMDHLPDCQEFSQNIRGKDGHVKEFTSSFTGIIEFKFRGKVQEASFQKSAMLTSQKDKNKSLEQILTVGQMVHFNADISSCSCKQDIEILVIDVWLGKKSKNIREKEKGGHAIPCEFEIPETLHHGPVYKATVIEIPNPFKFVVEVDNPTVQVLVYNDRFSPSVHEPPLSERDRVTSYISVGDKVSLIAKKFSSYSKQNWMATEAWIEDEDLELNNSKKKKGKQPEESLLTEEKVLQGEVYRVESTWGMLLCKNENLIVIFHSKTLRLFGVPAEEIHLNHLKLSGESINFVLEENCGPTDISTAQRAWLGSWESTSTQWGVIQRSMQLIEFCKAKDVDQQVAIHLAERIASQRSQIKKAEGKENKSSQKGREENSAVEPLLENAPQGSICPDTNNITKAEDGNQSIRTKDKKASSRYNNTENENSTLDSNIKSSPCRFSSSVQEDDELTEEDMQILSKGIKRIVDSQLSSVLGKLNIDTAPDDMKKEICKIVKVEIINIIEGDFLEKLLGISHTHTPRNILNARSTIDASSQTLSTGPVLFWEVNTDV